MANKINIEQLEEYLKQAGLDNGELENLLNPVKELNNQRRYGLVWEEPDNSTYGTDSAEQELLKNFPFLKEVNEHRIFNGEDHPDHLLIEGDNLQALKTMQYTHKNKIDVIYIDPPYNTGNTDFVYNDKFVDGKDSWRHSKWLSFMNKRLRLARELMTDNGVIFISIDDNEQAQLKLLCDQVFGENNFLATIHWRKNRKPHNAGNTMSVSHEFIHVYYKKNRLKLVQEYNEMLSDEHGDYAVYPIIQGDKKERIYTFKKGAHCESTINKGMSTSARNKKLNIEILDEPIIIDNILQNDIRVKGRFRLTDENGRLTDAMNENRIFFNSNGIPKEKRYRAENDKKVDNHYWDIDGGKNEDGNEEIKDIFNLTGDNGLFSYPKPKALLNKLLTSVNNPNAIVLDFFAGSGTTAHAVMELNKEDGGNRQAILITNNEIKSSEEEDFLVGKGYVEPFTGSQKGAKKHAKWLESVNEFKGTTEYKELIETDEYKDLGIARAVTEQRINKVINGYTTPKGKEVEGLSNNNFYHFEVELEPDLLDMDLNTYVLVNKTKDIIKMKEGVYTDELDISTNNIPAIKLVNEDKEVIVVQTVRVFEEDIHELVQNFNDEGKEHVIYTSYTGFEYGINNIRFEELPKELLQAIKHD